MSTDKNNGNELYLGFVAPCLVLNSWLSLRKVEPKARLISRSAWKSGTGDCNLVAKFSKGCQTPVRAAAGAALPYLKQRLHANPHLPELCQPQLSTVGSQSASYIKGLDFILQEDLTPLAVRKQPSMLRL